MAQLLTVPERKLVSVSSTATSQIGRAGLVEELKRIPGAPDPVLLETLPKGVAFHHAGKLFSLVCIFPAAASQYGLYILRCVCSKSCGAPNPVCFLKCCSKELPCR